MNIRDFVRAVLLKAPPPEIKLQCSSTHSRELVEKALADPRTLPDQRAYLEDLLRRKYP